MNTRKRTKQSAPKSSPAKPQAQRVTHVIAVDTEYTGPNVVENAMIEIGATFWKVGSTKSICSFERHIEEPLGVSWCAETAKTFWDDKKRANDQGQTLREQFEMRKARDGAVAAAPAMRDFVGFVRTCAATLDKDELVVLISDTAESDTSFINVYLGSYCPELCPNLNRVFGEYRSVRDIDSFFFGMGRRINEWGAEQAALDGLGEEKLPSWVPPSNLHSAREDAEYIGGVASYFLSRCEEQETADDDE